jgi:hypothetical protein
MEYSVLSVNKTGETNQDYCTEVSCVALCTVLYGT